MKISSVKLRTNLLSHAGTDPDTYDVKLSHQMYALVDRYETIVDVLPRMILTYTMQEAEDIVKALKTTWPDFTEDLYYQQGYAIFPISAPQKGHESIEYYHYSRNVTLYRYRVSGEWIYGLSTHDCEDPDAPPERYVEASMDGWEKWLRDHKRIISQRWHALH